MQHQYRFGSITTRHAKHKPAYNAPPLQPVNYRQVFNDLVTIAAQVTYICSQDHLHASKVSFLRISLIFARVSVNTNFSIPRNFFFSSRETKRTEQPSTLKTVSITLLLKLFFQSSSSETHVDSPSHALLAPINCTRRALQTSNNSTVSISIREKNLQTIIRLQKAITPDKIPGRTLGAKLTLPRNHSSKKKNHHALNESIILLFSPSH